MRSIACDGPAWGSRKEETPGLLAALFGARRAPLCGPACATRTSFVEIYPGLWPVGIMLAGDFYIFIFSFFTKNIFLFSKFTEIYPGRPAAGRLRGGRCFSVKIFAENLR